MDVENLLLRRGIHSHRLRLRIDHHHGPYAELEPAFDFFLYLAGPIIRADDFGDEVRGDGQESIGGYGRFKSFVGDISDIGRDDGVWIACNDEAGIARGNLAQLIGGNVDGQERTE